MKFTLIFILSFFFLQAFALAQEQVGQTGSTSPVFGSSYEKCAEWEKSEVSVETDGESPSECIRYKTCREQAIPGGLTLVSCDCYLGLTQYHPNWCGDGCSSHVMAAIGGGDSEEMAEKDARAVCDQIFDKNRANKDPNHYDFKVLSCRQKGQEVCDE